MGFLYLPLGLSYPPPVYLVDFSLNTILLCWWKEAGF